MRTTVTDHRTLVCLVALLSLGLMTSTASATIGSASLYVAGATSTPTHWNIPIGVPTTAELRGVSTAECGDPLPATITVWVKSSELGNTMLTATRIGASSDYSFTYTPPAVANGDPFDACSTTVVAYCSIGREANNDLADDGVVNGTAGAASGFRFLNGYGVPIDCQPVANPEGSWGVVKGMYR